MSEFMQEFLTTSSQDIAKIEAAADQQDMEFREILRKDCEGKYHGLLKLLNLLNSPSAKDQLWALDMVRQAPTDVLKTIGHLAGITCTAAWLKEWHQHND